MDQDIGRMDTQLQQTSRGRHALAATGVILLVAAAFALFGVRALKASTPVRVFLDPPGKAQLFYEPTPVVVEVKAEGWSGAGHTPVAGYQYVITWNPNILQWVSGPKVQAGTPTPQPMLSCTQLLHSAVTSTATPPGFEPTNTPTPTATQTPSNPTQTPEPTNTRTPTATPSGYMKVGCASLGGTQNPPTPPPSGVIGTFKFQPQANSQASSQLPLTDVKVLDKNGTPIVPTPVVTGGYVALVDCNDVNGDGFVNIFDLQAVAGAFGMSSSHPDWNPDLDVNNDGSINIFDLQLVAGGFGIVC